MKLRVRNLRLPLDHTPEDILQAVQRRLFLPPGTIQEWKIARQAVDARKKKVTFVLTAEVRLTDGFTPRPAALNHPDVIQVLTRLPAPCVPGDRPLSQRPVIVGLGPAGLFCGLLLARNGYRPIILEQGLDIDQRVARTETFWAGGRLDPHNNAQFGEGGGGTFSDGKLTTRIDDERVDYVLDTLVSFGADPAVKCLKKPHVGTDMIRRIVRSMREAIISAGGEVRFSSELTDIRVHPAGIKDIEINHERRLPCEVLILAVGNSARPVFRMFTQKGLALAAKSFAVGLRVEHPQDVIDRMQYGEDAGHPVLGPADYQFTYFDRLSGRSAYTFCMCPGGYVVAAASEEGQLVTNGMSYSQRDSRVANSAVVVTVTAADWGEDPLGGLILQEKLERAAFSAGGEHYYAPAQYLQDFLTGHASTSLEGSIATYRPGVVPANLWKILPNNIAEVLRRAFQEWGERAPEFLDPAAVLTGVETRTSAPVRMLRDDSFQAEGLTGLYPCGEGAGYAGGIVSAAADGLKVAEAVIRRYRLPVGDDTCDIMK